MLFTFRVFSHLHLRGLNDLACTGLVAGVELEFRLCPVGVVVVVVVVVQRVSAVSVSCLPRFATYHSKLPLIPLLLVSPFYIPGLRRRSLENVFDVALERHEP